MSEVGKGVVALIVACIIWGLSPIYYKQLSHIPPVEILAHRFWWSLVFFVGILLAQSRFAEIRNALSTKRNFALIALAAIMVSINWFVFIFAIQIDRVIEASLGYFIFPLVSVALGWFVFDEHLGKAQWFAVALGAMAVVILTFGLGVAPWLSLVIALSFGVYSALKKTLDIGPVVSVTAEVLLFTPVAIAVIAFSQLGGNGGFGNNWYDSLLLIVAGPLTALPLILFSYAAKRTSLSTVGVLQYINPTLQFLSAVVIFGEPFGPWHAIAFPIIWLALAVYSLSTIAQVRAARRAAHNASGVSTTSK